MLNIRRYISIYIMRIFFCENKINSNYKVYIRNNNILKNIWLVWRYCDLYINWDVIDFWYEINLCFRVFLIIYENSDCGCVKGISVGI